MPNNNAFHRKSQLNLNIEIVKNNQGLGHLSIFTFFLGDELIMYDVPGKLWQW